MDAAGVCHALHQNFLLRLVQAREAKKHFDPFTRPILRLLLTCPVFAILTLPHSDVAVSLGNPERVARHLLKFGCHDFSSSVLTLRIPTAERNGTVVPNLDMLTI